MSPTAAIPPGLPPSVEEAYRRKCIQLKQRTAEVEEANDGARLRIDRLRRQVEKMRLERAFLLEQLARRTSINVEDSEGSPSPPPTPQIQPKDKPLRIKRGHRKPSLMPSAETPPVPSPSHGKGNAHHTPSPGSETFSHTPADAQSRKGAAAAGTTNGVAAKDKPASAFELYCSDARPALLKDREAAEDVAEDADAAVEEELARAWKDLPADQKEEYQTRYEQELAADADAKDKSKDDDDNDKDKDEAKRGSSSTDADPENTAGAESGAAGGDDGEAEAQGVGEGEGEPGAEAEEGATPSINAATEKPADEGQAEQSTPKPHDEDVEMGNYDTDREAQTEKPEE